MNQKRISKLLSLVLRHQPQKLGLTLDEQGWASTQAIIEAMNAQGLEVDMEVLEEVVRTNDKQRFKLSEDKTRIRANQGHSIPVDLGMKASRPPFVLYHGTAGRNRASILKTGIQKRNRIQVHLSADRATAIKVGQRHGSPIVFCIDAQKMHEEGILFYQSENGVWLTDFVAAKYIFKK